MIFLLLMTFIANVFFCFSLPFVHSCKTSSETKRKRKKKKEKNNADALSSMVSSSPSFLYSVQVFYSQTSVDVLYSMCFSIVFQNPKQKLIFNFRSIEFRIFCLFTRRNVGWFMQCFYYFLFSFSLFKQRQRSSSIVHFLNKFIYRIRP